MAQLFTSIFYAFKSCVVRFVQRMVKYSTLICSSCIGVVVAFYIAQHSHTHLGKEGVLLGVTSGHQKDKESLYGGMFYGLIVISLLQVLLIIT